MKTKISLFSAVVCSSALLTGSPVMAQTDLLSGWSGSATLGALFTSGNSETSNINGSAAVSKQMGLYRHTAFGSTYSADGTVIQQDGTFETVETANRFDLGYKLDRQFNEKLYGFGRLRYDSDDYGNIDGRFTGVVGAGYRILDDGKQSLSGELGIGGHQTTLISLDATVDPDAPTVDADGLEIIDATAPSNGELESDGAVLYGGLNYSNILNEQVTFNSVFTFEASDFNTLSVWDNSLNVGLSESISLTVGLLARNSSDIAGSLGENTDTAARIGIVFGI